ncbi:hypothetical protein CLCR_06541 [Cladophialophora carrionii]|uniref:Uncharacterized protein n=1 Tax=Cladophialophora carrionii TaxID=86049 RepID=A0A1C1CNM1_9EURO|nr:hypothetical protein CLCR_06541 [Cladophialophora carrionii]
MSARDGNDVQSSDNHDFKKRKTVPLAFTKTYARDWTEKDAFREFYQNWRDGIIESFNLRLDQVRPIFVRNDHDEIHITASEVAESTAGTSTPRLLGYIIFKSQQGSLEVTNFEAKLERRHLYLGETNKGIDSRSAGGHGEGFKVGALVLRRSGYSSVLGKGAETHRDQQSTLNQRRGLVARIREDMTVKIGKSTDDKHGIRPKKNGISEETFRAWLTVSLDLDPPNAAQVIHTPAGDLIGDPRYRGRVYVKGLLVSEYGVYKSNGKDYRFGYNFNTGDVNRDRQSLLNPREEAKVLAKIWESAIAMKGVEMVNSYVELFNQDEEVPDIAMALKNVSRLTAKNICKYLKMFHPEAFFYSEREESEQNPTTDEDIISQELEKKPFRLPKKLWQIIRKHEDRHGRKLMLTPLEERRRLFQMSPRIGLPTDVFGLHIVRALKGAFSLDVKLVDLHFEFVDGAQTSIDLLYDQNLQVLHIHGKWLNFTHMHRGSSCEFFRAIGQNPTDSDRGFVCDHVVQDLLESAFDELRMPFGLTQESASCLRRNAVEYLRQMPRAVSLEAPEAANTLKVSWIGNESAILVRQFGANIHYSVTLHKASSCEREIGVVLNTSKTDISDTPTEADHAHNACGCPTRVIARAHSKAIFKELDHMEAYFPMVSRAEGPSFFGLPPPALKPRESITATGQTSDGQHDTAVTARRRQRTPSVHSSASGNLPDTPCGHYDDLPGGPRGDFDDSRAATSSAPRATIEPAAVPLSDFHNTIAQEDENTWAEWHDQYLTQAFSGLLPPRKGSIQVRGAPLRAPLHDRDLSHTFERRQYAWVQLNGESGEQVIYIHDIFQQENQSEVDYYLLATLYSSFRSIFPSGNVATNGRGAERENGLILHFSDFEKMRTPEDAALILLADVSAARCLDDGRTAVSHVFQHLPADHGDLYCRFAIRDSTAENTACLTPLAAHLLDTQEELWSRPKFCSPSTPLAFDLSPEVLGVSEGFSQAGFIIQAAFGIDETQPSTWKDRHNSAQTFDGAILDTFDDLNTKKLLPIQLPDPVPPRIVLLAGEHTYFRINKLNEQMPRLDQFLHDLEVIDTADAEEGPNFLVMLMSPALLHSSAMSRFSETILRLMKLRYSVHMKIVQVRQYGLPQERSILVIVASPICAPLPWNDERYTVQSTDVATLGELLADLNFGNDRMANKECSGFVCSPPQDNERTGSSSLVHVYNHYTGISVADGHGHIDVEANTTLRLVNGPQPWKHPDRPDRLTIRELARVQGIPDDFKFWGPIESQYEALEETRGREWLLPKNIAEGKMWSRMPGSNVGVRVSRSLPICPTITKLKLAAQLGKKDSCWTGSGTAIGHGRACFLVELMDFAGDSCEMLTDDLESSTHSNRLLYGGLGLTEQAFLVS